MNTQRNILLAFLFLIQLSAYTQTDEIIKKNHVSFATLIVDYDTYEFEGGNISYYTCPTCPIDSIPFTIDYKEPLDFGRITMKFMTLPDTIFDATIIWMGTGQIYYPSEYNNQTPFNNNNILTNKTDDIKYLYMDGNVLNDAELLQKADSAWNSIDSLDITKQFADNGFESAIYFYPPTQGMFDPNVAKWIIFLYHADKSNAIDKNARNNQSLIFPNPIKKGENIQIKNTNTNIRNYRITNSLGQLINTGEVLSGDNQINVSQLNSGLYFIYLSDINNTVISTEKLIIE